MNARMMDRKAVIIQNIYQSQTGGNIEPMAPKPPRLFAPSAEKTYCRSLTYPPNIPKAYPQPAGIQLSRL